MSNDGNDTITAGNSRGDYLYGDAGNDTLNGGTGSDFLSGGTGNDIYIINADTNKGTTTIVDDPNADGGIDTISFQTSTTAITVDLSQTGTQTVAPNVRLNSASLNGDETHLNRLIENAIGGSGADTITGNILNNRLDGGAGADTMSGGTGDDTYVVANIGDIVTEAAEAGNDTVESSITYTLTDNVENLTLTGTADINGTGNGLGNIITGNAGNNVLDGATGADAMNGGAGNDTYIVENAGDLVTEAAGAGTDTVQSSISYTLRPNVENLILTGTAITGAGNDLDNIITGNASDNTLNGAEGNDTLDGGLGADAMNGGLGNDTYIVDNAGDIVTEAPGAGTDIVQSSIAYTLTDNVENLTLTGTGNIDGTGNALDNIITGNSGKNTIKSGVGNDTLNAGDGDDKLDPGVGVDKIDGGAGTDTLTINNSTDTAATTINYTTVANGTITGGSNNGTTFQNIEGVNFTTGSGNDNINVSATIGFATVSVSGGAGDDTIVGSLTGSYGTYNGGDGNDSITGGNGGNNSLNGGDGNDTITSNSSATGFGDILSGGAGNDTLIGGNGSDNLSGGNGDDTYVINANVSQGTKRITETLAGGTDTLSFQASTIAISVDLSQNATQTVAPNVTVASSGSAASGFTGINYIENVIGSTGNDTIIGNALDNILDGGLGIDTMNGGLGNDTYIVDNGDLVIEAAGAGIDNVQSSITYTLADNVENLILTGAGDLNGTGNGLDNTITGNAGNNILDGGVGADTMIGGAGNDTYVVDNAADVVQANSTGINTVQSAIDYTLGANVQNLILTGAGDLSGTGNGLANTITGNAGNNILDGGLGIDTMIGGLGNDTYIIDNSGDIVTEAPGAGIDNVQSSITYTLTDNVESLTLTGVGDSNGTGNGLANTITGNAGNNILDGGLGIDTMIGGLGNDTYIIDNAGDIVTEAPGAGTDNVQSSVTYTLTDKVENLTLTGTTDLNGTGNGLANTITGNAGNNILDGGVGIDNMIGGLGNDTYIIDNAGDIVTEAPGAGIDNVQSSITYNLTDNVENLTLTGAGDSNGTGNTLANTITGNVGNNILTGGGGADTLSGGSGNDTYIVSRSLDGGTVINDLSGTNDTLSLLGGTTLTANQISRNSTTLLIDLNQNGIFDLTTDLSISNFFANTTGSAAGNGFIENVDSLSGSVVLNLYTPTRNDFNTDKKSDILWLNDFGSVALWQMDGSIVANAALTSMPDIAPSWQNAGTGDFNGDSKADILWRNTSGAVAVWQMDGSTVTSSNLASTPSVDNSWKNAGTGDFNGDGQSDILWRNDDGSVALWQMDSFNVVSSSLTSTSSLDNSWKINGTGDFNGNGKADILWRNNNTGAVAIWQMDGSTVVDSSLTSTPALDASWAFNGIGDFNGDRKSDILWRKDSGEMVVWQMDGSTVVSSLASTSADSSNWKVAGIV